MHTSRMARSRSTANTAAAGRPEEHVIGDQNLDFLMGTLSAFQQSQPEQNSLRGPIPSLYGQDTYHATKQS